MISPMTYMLTNPHAQRKWNIGWYIGSSLIKELRQKIRIPAYNQYRTPIFTRDLAFFRQLRATLWGEDGHENNICIHNHRTSTTKVLLFLWLIHKSDQRSYVKYFFIDWPKHPQHT